MSQSRINGTASLVETRRDQNGFVNRRSSVQSRPPARSSQKLVFTDVTARAATSGYLAGRVSARTAKAALAWLLHNSGAIHAVARRVAAGRITPRAGLLAAEQLARAAVAS